MTARKKAPVDKFIIVNKWDTIDGPYTQSEVEVELTDLYEYDGDIAGVEVYKLTPIKVDASVSINLGFPAAVPDA